MNVIRKQSIANSLIAYLGVALGYVNMGLLFPNVLETDQVGLINVIVALVTIIATFSKLGSANIVLRYFTFFNDTPERKKAFGSFLVTLSLIGLIATVVLYFAFNPIIVGAYEENSALFVEYNYSVVYFLIFFVFFELFFNYSRAALRSTMPTFLREFFWRLIVFTDIVLYHYQIVTFDQFFYIYIFSYSLPLVILILYLRYTRDLGGITLTLKVGDKQKELFNYGLFAILGGAASIIVTQIDRVMLASMTDLAETGVYGTVALFGSVIHIPARALLMIAIPLLAQHFKEGKMDQICRLYKKSSINQLIAGLFIFIAIYANMDNIFYFLPDKYSAGRWVIIYIGLAKLFDMATGINGGIILNSKYYRYDSYFSFGLVVLAIVTNFLLIPLYGIEGAAIASALSVLLYNAAKGIFVWFAFKMQPFTWKTLIALIIGAVTLAVHIYVLPKLENVYLNVLLQTSIVTILFGGLTILARVSDDVSELINKILDRVRS